MSKDDSKKSYTVGYGQPPRATRYPPGVSGNKSRGPNRKKKEAVRSPALSAAEQLMLETMQHELMQGDGTKVTAAERLMLQLLQQSLAGDAGVAKYLIDRYSAAEEKADNASYEDRPWVFRRKIEIQDEFDRAFMSGEAPPDVLPHPDHVHPYGEQLITGPHLPELRVMWEYLKQEIKRCISFISDTKRWLVDPTGVERDHLLKMLALFEKRLRALKRQVPKGWNWREEIWTRGSSTAEIEAWLKMKTDGTARS